MQQGKRLYLAVLAVLGWFAVIAQLYLIIVNRQASLPETITRFFSYFTVLTNILVAVCCTVLALRPANVFFSRASTQAALAVYIGVVGLVYNTILRFIWAPQGIQRVVDELLHLVIPGLYLIYWLIYAPKKELAWKQLPAWLLYPLVYVVFIIIRGAASDFYPYPFIDVTKLGYSQVLLNGAGLVVVFIAASAGIIAAGRFLGRKPAG